MRRLAAVPKQYRVAGGGDFIAALAVLAVSLRAKTPLVFEVAIVTSVATVPNVGGPGRLSFPQLLLSSPRVKRTAFEAYCAESFERFRFLGGHCSSGATALP